MTILITIVEGERCATGSWGLAQAKAQLSEVVERAMTEGPQEITRNGRDAVVIVSKKEWEAEKKARPSLAEFLLKSPLRGSGLKLEPRAWKPRKVDL